MNCAQIDITNVNRVSVQKPIGTTSTENTDISSKGKKETVKWIKMSEESESITNEIALPEYAKYIEKKKIDTKNNFSVEKQYELEIIEKTRSTKQSIDRSKLFNDEKQKDKEKIIAVIRSSYFEAGVLCSADYLFTQLITKYGSIDYVLKILSDIVNHNLNDDHLLEGVLHILSNRYYSEINPIGLSITIAAAFNHSPVIMDLLISCFEAWDSPDGIDVLEKLEVDISWIREYRDEVIARLKNSNESRA